MASSQKKNEILQKNAAASQQTAFQKEKDKENIDNQVNNDKRGEKAAREKARLEAKKAPVPPPAEEPKPIAKSGHRPPPPK